MFRMITALSLFGIHSIQCIDLREKKQEKEENHTEKLIKKSLNMPNSSQFKSLVEGKHSAVTEFYSRALCKKKLLT